MVDCLIITIWAVWLNIISVDFTGWAHDKRDGVPGMNLLFIQIICLIRSYKGYVIVTIIAVAAGFGDT